jgi:hypothetical protein
MGREEGGSEEGKGEKGVSGAAGHGQRRFGGGRKEPPSHPQEGDTRERVVVFYFNFESELIVLSPYEFGTKKPRLIFTRIKQH